MAATVFATSQNNCSTTVGPSGYTAGSGTLQVVTGGGVLFPSLLGGSYCRVTVIQAAVAYVPNAPAATYTIFKVTAITGDVLTIAGTLEGTFDRNYVVGDVVEIRVTGGSLTDLQVVANTLETTMAPLASPPLSGTPTAPTAPVGTNTTQVATTAFVLANGAPLAPLGQPTLAITGATTLTAANFGRLHICSGTATNYTVKLPSPTSNVGNFLSFMMAPGLTKLVTIVQQATDLIDGAATRVMWANETATLYCDGMNWTKIAGKSLSMVCTIYRHTAFNVPYNAMTTIPFDTLLADNTGLMADVTTNHRINVVRTSLYLVNACGGLSPLTNSANTQTVVTSNNYGTLGSNITGTPATTISIALPVAAQHLLSAGDFLGLNLYHAQAAGTPCAIIVDFPTSLGVVEVPQW